MAKTSSLDLVTAAQALDRSQNKVTAANQHLIHLENEVRAVQKRRQALSDEIAEETRIAVEKRKRELAELEAASATRIKGLDTQFTEATERLGMLKRRSTQVESENSGLEADNALLVDRGTTLTRQIKEKTAELDTITRKHGQLTAQTGFLQNGIAPLQDKQVALETSITGLEKTRDELEAKISTLDSTYNSRLEAISLDLDDLLTKKRQLDISYAETLRQQEQIGEELAVRAKVADEREEVLKRREFKVVQSERMVARNAGLLNL